MGRYFLVFIFLLAFSSPVQAKIVDKIVAVVDGQVITLSALEEFLGARQTRMGKVNAGGGIQKARRQALEQLIERKIILQEARDRKIKIRAERINRRLEAIRKRFASEKEFRQALQKENLSETDLRKRIKEDFMISVLVDREVKSKVRVGEEEIKQFYEKNKAMFKEPGEVELGHIFIKVKPGENWAEAGQKGKGLLKQLREGADFSSLTKKYSDGPNAKKGGDLGFLTPGELNPKFEQAVSRLKVGEISALIKMGDGFHIIKLEGRKDARQMALSEVRGRIESLIFAKKAEKRYQEWIKELKKKHYIEIK